MGRILAILSLAICMVGCGYDSFGDHKVELENPSIAITTIEELRERVLLVHKPIVVDSELHFTATVTANDKGGNLYQTFYVEDESGAMEVKAGLYNLYNYYPVGAVVEIELKGLSVGIWRNTLQLGVQSLMESYYPVDFVGYKPLLDMHISVVELGREPKPMELKLGEINGQMSGRLVRLSSLRLCEGEEITWAETLLDEAVGDGMRRFEDAEGKRIRVTTSRYADFATDEIPRGSVDIVGVLSTYQSKDGEQEVVIKMRGRDDCTVN